MKLSAVLVHAALLFSTALALSPDSEGGLEARARPKKGPKNPPKPAPAPVPEPTEADVKKHYHTIDADTCLFYAKVGTESDVRKVRDERDYLKGYKILEERWTDDWYKKAKNQMKGNKRQSPKKFFSMASRVLAKECAGTVYVLLPEGSGKDWDQTSIWNNEEYPNLSWSTKVIRLNMNDASHQEVIFDGSSSSSKRDAVEEETLEADSVDETLEARMPGKPKPKPKPKPEPETPPPTLADFKKQFGTVAPDSCLFYSKAGSERQIMAERDGRDYLRGYEILDERWKDRAWFDEKKKTFPGGSSAFFAEASQALAEACSGTVYVMLPEGEGTKWDKKSVWAKREWPNLARSTKVVRINMKDAGHQETIWDGPASKRGDVAEAAVPVPAPGTQARCTVQVAQWDRGDEADKAERFELEVTVKTAGAGGRVVSHQPRVTVADGSPLITQHNNNSNKGRVAAGLVVIPTGDHLGFSFRGVYWGADDNKSCELGKWADEDEDESDETRHREVRCDFTC